MMFLKKHHLNILTIAFLTILGLTILPGGETAFAQRSVLENSIMTFSTEREVNFDAFPAGEGREVVLRSCRGCHLVRDIAKFRHSKDKWASIVDMCVNNGAQVEDDEFDVIVNYLSAAFPGAR